MRFVKLFTMAVLATSVAGCAMCDSTFDDYYAAYGGSRPRQDMVNGRVGSLFEPADASVTPPTTSSVEANFAPASQSFEAPEDSATDEDATSDGDDGLAAELGNFLPGTEDHVSLQ